MTEPAQATSASARDRNVMASWPIPRVKRLCPMNPAGIRLEISAMELSVIVPCLNEEENVGELVARMASGFGAPFLRGDAELILIDDGSGDGTWAAMTLAKSRHAFVVPPRHRRNAGLAASWRTGVRRARGRLVCILD